MELNEYGRRALRTMSLDTTIVDGVLGLNGEAGEVADILKKARCQGHTLDIDKMKKELGDVLWYVAATAYFLHLDLETIAQANVAKLEARYPDGFDATISNARYVDDLIKNNHPNDEVGSSSAE